MFSSSQMKLGLKLDMEWQIKQKLYQSSSECCHFLSILCMIEFFLNNSSAKVFDVSGGGTREFVTNTNKYTKSYVGLPLQEDCVKNGGFQYHLGATIFSELCYFTGQVMLKLVLK